MNILNKITSEKGFTLVELLLAMAILSILAASLVSLLSTGSSLFVNTEKYYQSQLEARTALSYITVKIRQNDVAGAVELRRIAGLSSLLAEQKDALVIRNRLDSTKSWVIYFDDGVLYEKYCVFSSDELHLIHSHVIAEGLKNVAFEEETQAEDKLRKLISVSIEYFNAGGQADAKILKSKIALRTDY